MAFAEQAQSLLAEGTRRYGQNPFKIITTPGKRIILPASCIRWLEKYPNLDHQAQVAEEFFGSYPGFGAIGAFNDPNKFVIDLITKRMSSLSAPMLQTLHGVAAGILEEEFGRIRVSFHSVEWPRISTNLISRMCSSLFVGPSLTQDTRWQEVIQSYTVNLFNACRILRAWPAILRPIAVWLLPECRVLRAQIAEAREIIASHNLDDMDCSTAFQWMDARADPIVVQLALAAGALHTTSQLLHQALLDIAYATSDGQDIMAQTRDEYRACVEASGDSILPSTFARLNILEGCVKETQRLKPQTMNNLDRLALKPVILPNGVRILKGTMVSVNQDTVWANDTWGDDAAEWKSARWLASDDSSSTVLSGRDRLVSSSDRHFAFGKGRFICPGRFLVSAEPKVALGLILQGWDVGLSKEGYEQAKGTGLGRVNWIPYGFEMLANESVAAEVRRR